MVERVVGSPEDEFGPLRTEARVRSSLDSLLEGAQIIDREWRYVYLNATAAAHGGTTADALLGRTMMEAFPGIDETPMFAMLRRAMDAGEPADMENEFVRPDGTRKWFQLMVQPVPEGLFILSLDITARKRAEEELELTRARLFAIVDNLHEGLILADLDGNLLYWNRAALGMLDIPNADSVIGPSWEIGSLFELHTSDGRLLSPDQRPLARVLRGEQFHDLEIRVSRPGQGWERILAYSGATVRYGGDNALAFVTIRDVTERKELERRYARAQRMDGIGALTGGIAHDLNNVFMPILIGTSTLRRKLALDARASRTLQSIERSAERGADLVKQILSFVRGTTGEEAIEIRSLAAEVHSIASQTFPKDVTLEIDLPEGLDAVRGDPTQLLQVLLNLCVNARDAMPEGGRMTITARNTWLDEESAGAQRVNPGRFVVVEVIDQGTGMPPDVLERIFEPFFTTKAIGFGTGLGLATVRDIVRSHGGFTTIASEVGKGTTFTVYLPSDTQPAGTAKPEEAADLARGSGELILLVDDEIAVLSVAKEMLESFGYEAITATNGQEALASYAARPRDIAVVVTDMMMPMMDGAKLIASILEMEPDQRIIATSGTSSADWLARAERAGARHFLAKPYGAPVLLQMLADLLTPLRRP